MKGDTQDRKPRLAGRFASAKDHTYFLSSILKSEPHGSIFKDQDGELLVDCLAQTVVARSDQDLADSSPI